MRICKKCKIPQSSDCFYSQVQRGKKGQEWRYFDSYCKSCRGKYTYDRRRLRKAQAIEYLGGKCVRCGLGGANPVVYDFHHRDPSQKDFPLSNSNKTFENLKVELDKCDLMCANCHRIVHDELSGFQEA
jgi:predicted HNH restriction endonuclease